MFLTYVPTGCSHSELSITNCSRQCGLHFDYLGYKNDHGLLCLFFFFGAKEGLDRAFSL